MVEPLLYPISTIPKSRIKGRIAVLSAERKQQIEDAIRFALDLPLIPFGHRLYTSPRPTLAVEPEKLTSPTRWD